jgi:hypothetical protein
MPFFGLLVIVIGVWLLVNTFNGNLLDVVEGKARFFWQSPPTNLTGKFAQRPGIGAAGVGANLGNDLGNPGAGAAGIGANVGSKF